MPSAMSSPSEPVEMASTSTACSFWPSRMMEPLPQFRSICEIAASSAFSLSISPPSTRRSATFNMADSPYFIGPAMLANAGKHYPRGVRPKLASPLLRRARNVHVLFSVRNLFFSMHGADVSALTENPACHYPWGQAEAAKPGPDQRAETLTNMSLGKAEIVRLFLAQARELRDKRGPRPAQERGNTYLKLISGAGDCGPHIVFPRRLKVSGAWC